MVPFEPYIPISQFLQKKFFDLQASSAVMLALQKGDFISIPHCSSVSVIVTILSKLAPRYGLSLDSDNPGSSTAIVIPFLLISLVNESTAFCLVLHSFS